MIPLFAVIRISTRKDSEKESERLRQGKRPRSGRLGLWVPLFLVWLLLLPFVLVLLPLAVLALIVIRVNPFRALATFWQILSGLTGTNIEVDAPDAMVLVRIF